MTLACQEKKSVMFNMEFSLLVRDMHVPVSLK